MSLGPAGATVEQHALTDDRIQKIQRRPVRAGYMDTDGNVWRYELGPGEAGRPNKVQQLRRENQQLRHELL